MKRTAITVIGAGTLCLALLMADGLPSARACTIFCDSQGGTALVGNNEDYLYSLPAKVWFVPAMPGAHGRVCFGWSSWAQGGINDQGLFMDGAALGNLTNFNQVLPGKPVMEGALIERVLANCATVEEAITYLDQFAYKGNPAHSLIADRFGNSVVCEWHQGEFRPLRKKGRYQLITNFPLLDPQAGGFPCVRNMAASRVLESNAAPSVAECTAALQAAAADYGTSGTIYSQVYDLAQGDIYLYYRRHFETPLKINVAAELRKGLRTVDLQDLYEKGTAMLARPETMTARPIPMGELGQKVRAARGGSTAVTNIHSYRITGALTSADADIGRVEVFATRSNRFRMVAEVKADGRQQHGFDGQTAWEIRPGQGLRRLTGWEAEQHKNITRFFNWYTDPGFSHPTGHAVAKWFEGRECYEVKFTDRSGKQVVHYYDATNHLLAGIAQTMETQSGPTWSELILSDHQPLSGSPFPTRWRFQAEGSEFGFRIKELQVNAVVDSALAMPNDTNPPSLAAKPSSQQAKRTPIRLDPAVFDAYAGYYKLKPNGYFSIERAGDGYTARFSGQSAAEIFPESEIDFFYTVIDAQLTFVRDSSGKTTGFILHEGGADQPAARLRAQVDPPVLDACAGEYRFGADSGATNLLKPGTILTVRRESDGLTAQVGSSSGELVPESETNFFGRMSGTEYTFARDDQGRVTHLVFHNGAMDARATKISSETPKVDPRRFDAYAGRYEFTPDVPITVTRVRDQLSAQWVGAGTEIFPASETNFFSRTMNVQFTFVKDDRGNVKGLILHEGGLSPAAKKVK